MGFFAVIPILATYIVLRLLIGYMDGLLSPVLGLLPVSFPGLGLLIFAAAIYALGIAVSARLGSMLINGQHALFSKLPIIKSIYRVTKQASDYLSTHGGHDFKRVVLVEWPKRDVYALGFVTGQCTLQGNEDRLTIYIPTVPNPTSGMFALMAQSEVVETDISVEEAVKIVLSGGIVLPEKLSAVNLPRRDDWDDDYPYDERRARYRVPSPQIPLAFDFARDRDEDDVDYPITLAR